MTDALRRMGEVMAHDEERRRRERAISLRGYIARETERLTALRGDAGNALRAIEARKGKGYTQRAADEREQLSAIRGALTALAHLTYLLDRGDITELDDE